MIFALRPLDAAAASGAPSGAPREPQDCPRWPSDGPRWLLNGPRWPQDVPRRPRMAPEVAEKRPKMAPRRPPEDSLSAPNIFGTSLASHLGLQGLKEPPDHPKMSPKVAPRWPKRLKLDAKLLPAVSLCFPRRSGDSAVHFLIPTFVQRFATTVEAQKPCENLCVFRHFCPRASQRRTTVACPQKAGGGGDSP